MLRGYYLEHAPEIAPYLLSDPPAERLVMQRVPGDRWQGYRTVAGMIAVITAVLAGSTAALAAILIFDHSLAAAVISGTLIAAPDDDRDDPIPGFGVGTRSRRPAHAR